MNYGYLLIFLAALLWALIGVFTRGILDEGVGAMEIAFWRAVIGGAIFIVHALILRKLRLRKSRDAWGFLAFGLVGVTLFFAAYNLALEAGGISLAVVLLYTAPAFVVILARIFLKELITPLKLTALCLVIAGVSLVAFGGTGHGVNVTWISLSWGLAAGISYASYYVVGKGLLIYYHPVTIYALIMPVGALGLLPFVTFSAKSPQAWLLIALLSFFSTYLAYLVYYTGLKRVEASRAVLVASMEPVIAGGLAALFFGERLGVWGLIGASLVVMASLSAVFFSRSSKI